MLLVKEICNERGITLKQLAERLEMNRVQLSRTINGNPTLESLKKIANALDVEVRELIAVSGPVGSIEYMNKIYRIESRADLENILKLIEN